MTGTELDWLAAERPAASAPDAIATRRARRELLAHATGEAPAAVRSPAAARASRHRRRRGAVLAGAATIAAAAAVVVALASGGGHGRLAAVDDASAATLKRLSKQALALPAPTGDATLVKRVQAYPDRPAITGYDLYGDDGTYYYGANRAELRHAVKHGDAGYAELKKMLAVAVAAPQLDADVARERFLDAAIPNRGQAPAPPSDALAAKEAAAKKRTAAQKAAGLPVKVFTRAELDDNMVWTSAMDVLEAGAARPQVRAGVLKLLATVPSVSVTKDTHKGRPTLILRCTDFSENYVETLVIDAGTGVPISMTGGTDGATPSVVATYEPTRTTLARQGAR